MMGEGGGGRGRWSYLEGGWKREAKNFSREWGILYPPPLTTKTSPATLCSMWLHRKRFGGLLHLPLVTEDPRPSICEDFEPVLSKFGGWERAALTKRSV